MANEVDPRLNGAASTPPLTEIARTFEPLNLDPEVKVSIREKLDIIEASLHSMLGLLKDIRKEAADELRAKGLGNKEPGKTLLTLDEQLEDILAVPLTDQERLSIKVDSRIKPKLGTGDILKATGLGHEPNAP